MASSIRSTLWTIVVVSLLFLAVLAGAFGWGWWKQRAVRQDLATAEVKLSEGKPAEADALLAEYLDRERPTGTWVDQALTLRFQALDQLIVKAVDPKVKTQYLTAAQTLADRILDVKKPWVKKGQSAWSRAHLVLAQAALNAEKADAAKPHIQAILELPEGTPGRDEAQLSQYRIMMAGGEILEAQKQLEALLGKLAETSPARSGAEFALGLCNMSILKSQAPQEGDQIYTLQKGDTLDRLKRKFRISSEILQAINYPLDPKRLTIGRRIKIPNLEFSMLVNKVENTLALYNHGKFFKKYRVRTGDQTFKTPTGDFRIGVKLINPPWRNPKDGKSYASGVPGNELGCRWMSFVGSSLGIHEAIDPSTIGGHTSNGCVGMLKDDVIELYDLVPVGTPLRIVDKPGATPLTLALAGAVNMAPVDAEAGAQAAEAGAEAATADAPKPAASTKKSGVKTRKSGKTTKKKN